MDKISVTNKVELDKIDLSNQPPPWASPGMRGVSVSRIESEKFPSGTLTADDFMEAINEAKQQPPAHNEFPTGLPLFEVSSSLIHEVLGMPPSDMDKMLEDMQAADVLRLPYNQIAIRFYPSDIFGDNIIKTITFAPKGEVSLGHTDAGKIAIIEQKFPMEVSNNEFAILDPDNELGHQELCWYVLSVLLIALATRNVVKTVERNTRFNNKHKPPKEQFRGPNNTIFISHTRIEAPRVEDMEQGEGSAKRPHLRRGHAHTVCHGIRHRERKVMWFPAVFVNGDPDHTPAAKRYVVNG